MRIQWTPSLSVGIDEVDALQRDFFVAAERLAGSVTASDAVFEAALRALADVARAQFAAEERWLREAAEPSLPRHELEHRRFLDDLVSYSTQLARGQRAGLDALRLANWVNDWILAHMAGADRDLAKAVRASSPEERRRRMKLASA